MIEFKDLKIGDIFTYHGHKLIKIADNPNYRDSANKQYPNAINLNNEHYSVIGYKSPCTLIKSRTDERYRPEED